MPRVDQTTRETEMIDQTTEEEAESSEPALEVIINRKATAVVQKYSDSLSLHLLQWVLPISTSFISSELLLELSTSQLKRLLIK